MNASEFEAKRQQLAEAEDRRLVHEFALQHYLDDTVEQQIADYCRDHQRPGAKSAQFAVPRSAETQQIAEMSDSEKQLIAELVSERKAANLLLRNVPDSIVAELIRTDPKQRAERQQDEALRADLELLGRQFGLTGHHHITELERIAKGR
jgi:hypothetical protein